MSEPEVEETIELYQQVVNQLGSPVYVLINEQIYHISPQQTRQVSTGRENNPDNQIEQS